MKRFYWSARTTPQRVCRNQLLSQAFGTFSCNCKQCKNIFWQVGCRGKRKSKFLIYFVYQSVIFLDCVHKEINEVVLTAGPQSSHFCFAGAPPKAISCNSNKILLTMGWTFLYFTVYNNLFNYIALFFSLFFLNVLCFIVWDYWLVKYNRNHSHINRSVIIGKLIQ